MSKYEKIYKPTTESEIKARWEKVFGKIGVYIHSPFCNKLCKYCLYKGCAYNKHDYEKYYNEYLPRQINFYSDLLKSGRVKYYYFGGGTPTINTVDTFKNIFHLLPNLAKKGNIIEIHPGVYSDEQLQLFNEYNFDSILCIQTFDEEMLKKQNRDLYTFDDIEKIKNQLKSKYILSDLIIFLNEEDHIGIFMRDLEKIGELQPHEITIAPDLRFRNSIDFQKYTANYAHIIETFLLKYGYYADGFFTDYNKIKEYLETPGNPIGFRAFKNGINKEQFKKEMPHLYNVLSYNIQAKSSNYSTIGIGSLNNMTDTFSVINNDLVYIERNKDWKPNYYVMYDKSDYKLSNMIADFFSKITIPIPKSALFEFSSNVVIEDDGRFKTFREKLNVGVKCINFEFQNDVDFLNLIRFINRLYEEDKI